MKTGCSVGPSVISAMIPVRVAVGFLPCSERPSPKRRCTFSATVAYRLFTNGPATCRKPERCCGTNLCRKISLLPEASRGERILYSSTNGLNDKDRVSVSGALFWPKGDAPAGGWPIVAWAHGTVGTADKCAPSFAGRSDRDIQYLNSWLKAGFAVVATDYQGLGTAGGHPYLAAKPEGYSVLDSVRAVRDRNGLGDRRSLWGRARARAPPSPQLPLPIPMRRT